MSIHFSDTPLLEGCHLPEELTGAFELACFVMHCETMTVEDFYALWDPEPWSDEEESPALSGYLCEHCLDAPAVQLQPAPWGGEMGVCQACTAQPALPSEGIMPLAQAPPPCEC